MKLGLAYNYLQRFHRPLCELNPICIGINLEPRVSPAPCQRLVAGDQPLTKSLRNSGLEIVLVSYISAQQNKVPLADWENEFVTLNGRGEGGGGGSLSSELPENEFVGINDQNLCYKGVSSTVPSPRTGNRAGISGIDIQKQQQG